MQHWRNQSCLLVISNQAIAFAFSSFLDTGYSLHNFREQPVFFLFKLQWF